MKKSVAAVILFGSLSLMSCATSSLYHGENLIQPLPLPAGPWKTSQSIKDQVTALRWLNSAEDEMFTTWVFLGYGGVSATSLKDIDENSARSSCADFKSEIVNNATEMDFKSVTWKITCYNKDGSTKSVSLNKAIAGQDSMNRVQKVWWPKPSIDSWNTWLDYLKKIYVCDTRSADRKCPDAQK